MPDWLSTLLDGAVATILATGATLIFTWRATWTPYEDQATKLALDIDRMFITHPQLRVYFYEEKPFPSRGQPDYPLAEAVREFVADCLEGIWDNQAVYNDDDWRSWLKYIQDMLASSPGLLALIEDDAKLMEEDNEADPWYPSLGKANGILDRKSYKRPSFERLRQLVNDLRQRRGT